MSCREQDIAALKSRVLASGLTVSQLVSTPGRRRRRSAAPTSAAGPTGPHPAGAAEGLEVNQPAELARVLQKLEAIRKEFNGAQSGRKKVSLADLIVLGGCAAVEEAAKKASHDVKVPFSPAAPMLAGADRRRVLPPCWSPPRTASATTCEPAEDAGRGTAAGPRAAADAYRPRNDGAGRRHARSRCELRQSRHGVLTARPGTLTNDFFVNLLDMRTEWRPSSASGIFEGRDRSSGQVRWTGTRVDLVFGSNSELRALAEVYASDDAGEKFVKDFVAAWSKVMNLDRYDLA